MQAYILWYKMFSVWFYLNLGVVLSVTRAGDVRSLEVCNGKAANFSCAQDEVILMQKAEYGRMNMGICVKKNLGYLGCRINVLAALDKVCSGKQRCSFFLPMPDMDISENSKHVQGYQPCNDQLALYLQINYICVTVIPHPSAQCVPNEPIAVPHKTGYLAPHTNLGSHTCPFRLTTEDGQHFDIKLFSFLKTPGCTTIAEIYDRKQGSTQELSTCDLPSLSAREKQVYSSRGHDIQVTFTSGARKHKQVLLHYQVSGCVNISTSPGQVFIRTGQTAQLICNRGSSVEKSFLECRGMEWFGYKNCSTDGATMATGTDGGVSPTSFPVGLVVVVAIGVGLGIFLGGIMLICVNIYMKRKHRHDYTQPDYDIHDMDYNMQLGQHCKVPDLRTVHHPSQNHPLNTATLISHHNGGDETLVSISGPRCAKHCSPQGPLVEEIIGGNIDDLTKSSFMPPYKGENIAPVIVSQANKEREKDYMF